MKIFYKQKIVFFLEINKNLRESNLENKQDEKVNWI